MDTMEFMEKNGIEMFDTWDGYAYTDEGYDLKPEEEEEGLKEKDQVIPSQTQFRWADLNRAKMNCPINNCGNSVIKFGELCYYCKKKKEGLI